MIPSDLFQSVYLYLILNFHPCITGECLMKYMSSPVVITRLSSVTGLPTRPLTHGTYLHYLLTQQSFPKSLKCDQWQHRKFKVQKDTILCSQAFNCRENRTTSDAMTTFKFQTSMIQTVFFNSRSLKLQKEVSHVVTIFLLIPTGNGCIPL